MHLEFGYSGRMPWYAHFFLSLLAKTKQKQLYTPWGLACRLALDVIVSLRGISVSLGQDIIRIMWKIKRRHLELPQTRYWRYPVSSDRKLEKSVSWCSETRSPLGVRSPLQYYLLSRCRAKVKSDWKLLAVIPISEVEGLGEAEVI